MRYESCSIRPKGLTTALAQQSTSVPAAGRCNPNECANAVVRSWPMDLPSPRPELPDGALICRHDGTGRRIAVLPTTCKAGAHQLMVTERGATVLDGELRLSCPACAAIPGSDHTWRLTLTGASPECAELDDQPYVHLRAHRAGAASVHVT